MPYNWKCCSLYPNNFGASALPLSSVRVSTGQCTCFHRPVETCLLASGRQLITEKNGPPLMVEPFGVLPLIFIHKVG